VLQETGEILETLVCLVMQELLEILEIRGMLGQEILEIKEMLQIGLGVMVLLGDLLVVEEVVVQIMLVVVVPELIFLVLVDLLEHLDKQRIVIIQVLVDLGVVHFY
jgi:hypothetical protein